MNSLPCQGCQGLCCGPVPITQQELKQLKRLVKSLPPHTRNALQNQHRYFGTCIFFDLDQDKCGVHSARPAVCQAFGHYENLICFRKPEAAAPDQWNPSDEPAGVLSIDFTWKDFN